MNFDPSILELSDGVYLDGYWQSVSYFSEFADTIRAELSFRDQTLDRFGADYVDSVRRASEPVVAVHVRRGDLAYAADVLRRPIGVLGAPLSSQYFNQAVEQFARNSSFLIFSESSDDLDWCRRNIRARYCRFVEPNSDLHDFVAMKYCDHHIISNSTFSWWAAWLSPSPGNTVAPCPWFRANSGVEHRIHDLVPHAWDLVEVTT